MWHVVFAVEFQKVEEEIMSTICLEFGEIKGRNGRFKAFLSDKGSKSYEIRIMFMYI